MKIKGTNVSKGVNGEDPLITGIVNATTITADVSQTAVTDNTLLTFHPVSIGSSKLDFINAVELDSNIVIQGYVKVGTIEKSASLPLHLDNIITVA
jgi:hypothetical protein